MRSTSEWRRALRRRAESRPGRGAGLASAARPHPVTPRARASGRVSIARWLAAPARVRASAREWVSGGKIRRSRARNSSRGIAPRGGCLIRAVPCRAPARACACAGSRRVRRPSASRLPVAWACPAASAACLCLCRLLKSGRARRPPKPWHLPRRCRRTVRVGARRGARRCALAALARLK